MDQTFNTLQEFLLHTKNVTYILIVLALIAIGLFWRFLSAGDEE